MLGTRDSKTSRKNDGDASDWQNNSEEINTITHEKNLPDTKITITKDRHTPPAKHLVRLPDFNS